MDREHKKQRHLPKQGVDLDLFCTIKNNLVHIATMGKEVPYQIREKISQRNFRLELLQQEICTEAQVDIQRIEEKICGLYDYIDEYGIAEDLEDIYRDVPSFSQLSRDKYPLPVRLYASTNIMYAKKGCYSYSYNDNSETFVLIASPQERKEDSTKPAIDELIDPTPADGEDMPIEFSFKERK